MLLQTIDRTYSTVKPQLAVAWDKPLDKLEYPVIAEPKLDGVRCVCLIDFNGEPSFWSRDEKPFVNFEELEDEIRSLVKKNPYLKGHFLDGEILAKSGRFDDTISRARSHRGKNTHIDYIFYIFDFDSISYVSRCAPSGPSGVPLFERKKRLLKIKEGIRIRTVPFKIINSAESLFEYHWNNCDLGYEGTMVKPLDSYYHNGRNKDWKKIKPFHTADLRIVGMSEGKGKASGMMGRIIVEGEIGDLGITKVRCEVGTGFTDELRKEMWTNQNKYLGMTAEIQYQEVTKDNSLRFPSFKRFRLDRDLQNEIKEMGLVRMGELL